MFEIMLLRYCSIETFSKCVKNFDTQLNENFQWDFEA